LVPARCNRESMTCTDLPAPCARDSTWSAERSLLQPYSTRSPRGARCRMEAAQAPPSRHPWNSISRCLRSCPEHYRRPAQVVEGCSCRWHWCKRRRRVAQIHLQCRLPHRLDWSSSYTVQRRRSLARRIGQCHSMKCRYPMIHTLGLVCG
jgi:hypothetical protein